MKQGNVLFNDTTYFIYGYMGVRHIVKDHSDGERGNPLSPLHVLVFSINSMESFT